MGQDEATNAYLLKAEIMLNLNKLDSASYFLIKIWIILILMEGLYVMMECIRVAKRKGPMGSCDEKNMDADIRFFMILSKLWLTMRNLIGSWTNINWREHKRLLSERITKTLVLV